jgi:hypothetical protein
MNTTELINEIEKLPVQKQIFVVERTLHLIRQRDDINQMKKAADMLLSDYKTDYELTSFTNIDFDDFYESR